MAIKANSQKGVRSAAAKPFRDGSPVPELPDVEAVALMENNLLEFRRLKKSNSDIQVNNIDALKTEFNDLAPDLTIDGWKAAIAAAQDDAMLSRLRKSDNAPTPYQQRTKGLHLVEYLRAEWLAKGWNPRAITRKVVSEYDPPLANAIATYEHRTALLPDDVRFGKALARVNAQERKVAAKPA